MQSQPLSNGIVSSYAYNARSFLTDLLNKGGSTTLSEFGGSTQSTAMTYDALGDVTSVKASVPAAPGSYSGTTSYQYDGKTELTQEASTRSGGYTNANSYDLAENPTQVRGVTQPTANADNQLPVSGVTYDGNGNPSKVEGLTASFDIENRATALGGVTNTWGGNGLRASKTTSGGTTYFLYDGSVPVCELSSTGAVTATNTFGGAGLISRHTSGGSTFYTFDAQGNVAQRYTSTGSLVSSDLYDAFGKGTSTGGGDVFGYEGKFGYYTDITTGLILCGHRFYDASAGRFVNRDPIGYDGGTNLYGYTGNNPANFVDPSGFAYIDIGGNVNIPGIAGGFLTVGGGFQVDGPSGTWNWYLDGGASTPPGGFAVQFSTGKPSGGWFFGFTGGTPVWWGGSIGLGGLGTSKPGGYVAGGVVSPGASGVAGYVSPSYPLPGWMRLPGIFGPPLKPASLVPPLTFPGLGLPPFNSTFPLLPLPPNGSNGSGPSEGC